MGFSVEELGDVSGFRWNTSLLIRSVLPKDPARKLVPAFLY